MLKIVFQLVVCLLIMMVKAQEPVNVVVTFSILGDFVKAVGGDLVNVNTLVGPDSDPHEYEPVPRDSAALAEVDIIVENGLEFETWLDDLYKASGSEARRAVVTEGIAARPITEFDSHEDDEGDTHEDNAEEHGEFDPHLWQNPQLVMQMIDNIALVLSSVDPANQTNYLENAARYKAELEQLDMDLLAMANALTVEQRKLVTSHDAIGYFADRYGFEVIGAVISSTTTETSDANAGELAELIDTIKAAKVSAIFVENTGSIGIIEQIARSANVVIAPALYTDALGDVDTEGETYIGMMRYNMGVIVEALKAGGR